MDGQWNRPSGAQRVTVIPMGSGGEGRSTHDRSRARVRQVADECIEEVGGDWTAAADRFRQRLDSDRELYDELVAPLIEGAIWDAIRGASSRQRRRFCEESAPAHGSEGAEALARANERDLLDYPLTGGVRLGDATRDVLIEQIALHRAQARGNLIAATWLRKIADVLKDDERVGDRFDHERLAKLRKAASEEV